MAAPYIVHDLMAEHATNDNVLEAIILALVHSETEPDSCPAFTLRPREPAFSCGANLVSSPTESRGVIIICVFAGPDDDRCNTSVPEFQVWIDVQEVPICGRRRRLNELLGPSTPIECT